MPARTTTPARKTRNVWGILIVVAGLLLVIIAGMQLLSSDSKPPPADIEAKRVKISFFNEKNVETTQLKSGARFFMKFEPRDPADVADGRELITGIDLALKRDGKALLRLVGPMGGHPEPEVRSMDDPVEALGVLAPGSLEFVLPPLGQGYYQLCSAFTYAVPDHPNVNPIVEKDPFCKTIEVVS